MLMRVSPIVAFVVLSLQVPLVLAQSAVTPEAPIEIVVTGRQPGPPKWKVSNGNNEMWIFAFLAPIPQDMIWESAKVETVIAQSQAYLGMPQADVSASPLLLLNPINLVRGYRFAKRLSRNADGATLAAVLPADAWQRFEALKLRYFPDDKKIEKLRPVAAGGSMVGVIQQEAGLVGAGDVMRQINRMVRRNRDMERITIEATLELEGSYRTLARRVESAVDSIAPELELACFESQLARMETDLDEMKIRANSWAQGYIDEFRGIPAPRELHAACENMLLPSGETAVFQRLQDEVNAKWLDAAEAALANNASAFAVLNIYELLRADGLLAQLQLQARGYEVRAP